MVYRRVLACGLCISSLEQDVIEGENPVCCTESAVLRYVFEESRFLGLKRKVGGKVHLKLNTCERPIANKYREGKMKRTLKRELKQCLKSLKEKRFGEVISGSILSCRVGCRRVG